MRVRKFNLYAVFFIVAMLFAMPMTAHADSIYIESQGITVETKETPTETVVVDMRKVLSDGQIQNVKEAGTKLKIYNVGLYVEMTEKATCSQKYANSLAEQKFEELLPAENSVMIVFSFYEDAGGYYAVHYNLQGDFSESKVNRIIEGSYHDFKSDSTWIAGSFEQVVDYLTEVENNLINADAIAEQRHAALVTLGKIARAMIECFAIVAIIYLAWEIKSKDKEWRAYTDKKDRKIESLTKEAKRQDAAKNKLKERCDILQAWKDDAIESTPEIEGRITEHRAKRRAKEFDKTYKKAEGYKMLSSMISEYDAMSVQEKGHVKLDITKAKQKLEELAKAEAEKATNIIHETCKQTADRHHLNSYDKTLNYYNGLPNAVRMLIAARLVSQLIDGHPRAKSDYSRHSHSSSSSSSSFSHRSSSMHTGGFHSGTFGGGFHGGH